VKASADLPACGAAQGAARVALEWLSAAQAAALRLGDPDDEEALHDFRVALRRLRSTLRLYQPELGERVPARLRRNLKKLARATNVARDVEVQLFWLRDHRMRLRPRERAGRKWWEARVETRRAQGYEQVSGRALAAFRNTAPQLDGVLSAVASQSDDDAGGFGRVTGQRLQENAEVLQGALGKIRAVTDIAEIHAARIAGKRLRYLLEPVASLIPGGRAAVREMKRLQDEFGLLHDTFVRMAELEDAVQAAGAERARAALRAALTSRAHVRSTGDPLPGLVALARMVQLESRRRFRTVARDYLGTSGQRFALSLKRLGASLHKRWAHHTPAEPIS